MNTIFFLFNFHSLLEVYRVHGFEPFPGIKIFRNVLFLNLKFSGSHITSEMKTEETILNAIRADAPKGVLTGEGMWPFSASIVSSLGESSQLQDLWRALEEVALGAIKRYSHHRWSVSILSSQRAILVLGKGGEQGACPRENISGKGKRNQDV